MPGAGEPGSACATNSIDGVEGALQTLNLVSESQGRQDASCRDLPTTIPGIKSFPLDNEPPRGSRLRVSRVIPISIHSTR